MNVGIRKEWLESQSKIVGELKDINELASLFVVENFGI